MTVMNIPEHENAQCKILLDDGVYYLRSYDTLAAMYSTRTGEIDCTGIYSRTTAKHISWFAKFLNQMCGTNLSYDVFKSAIA